MLTLESNPINLPPSLVSRLPECLELLPQTCRALGEHLDDAHAYFSEILQQALHGLKANLGCVYLSGDNGRWRFCLGLDHQGFELEEPEFQSPAAQECLSQARVAQQCWRSRHWLGSPLQIQGDCVGVICLYRLDEGLCSFTPGEGQLLDCVARQASVVLWQARLRHQLDRSLTHLNQEQQFRLELQKQNQRWKQHALMACHEIQAPLRSLAGLARLAQGDQLQPEALHSCLQGIGQAASQLSRLQQSLLEYCRASCLSAPRQRISSATVITEVCQELEPLIQETRAEIQRDSLPWCLADPIALRSIFRALIHNALMYRRGKPVVQIQFRQGVFRVKDQGMGIPPEHHQRVLQPFVRLHSSEEIPGQGLGLSICRQLVDNHQGQLWLENNPEGAGLTVCFNLGDEA